MALQEIVHVAIERTDVDLFAQQRIDDAARRDQRADPLRKSSGAQRRQMMPYGLIARLRMLDGPADAAAERVAQLHERAVGAHDKIGAIARLAAIARRRRDWRGDDLRLARGGRERKAAHEDDAEIAALPQR